jgi:hypothetical protein
MCRRCVMVSHDNGLTKPKDVLVTTERNLFLDSRDKANPVIYLLVPQLTNMFNNYTCFLSV